MKTKQESIGRRATRTFFASVVGKLIALVITTITFIAIARLLGPSGYGIYTVAIGYAALIGAVSIFGIAAYFDRNIASLSYKKDGKGIGKVIANGYAIIIPASIVLAVIGIGLSGYISGSILQNSGIAAFTLILVSIDLMFSTIWGASFSALIGFGRGKLASIALVAIGIVQLGLGVALIYAGYGVNGAVAGLLAGDFVGFALTSYYVYSAVKEYGKIQIALPKWKDVKETLIFALPVLSNNILVTGVVGFGTLFLSVYAPNYILGNYGTALKGLGMMNVIYGTLAIVLIQAFSTVIAVTKKPKEISDAYNKTISYSLLLNLPVVVFVGVFSKPLVNLFLGASYSLAPTYLFIIAVGTSMAIINSFTASFFIAAGKVKDLMWISLIAVVIQVISLILLVPAFTAIGAIVALYIIGSVSTLLLFIRGLRAKFGIRMNYKEMLSLFVANLVMGMLVSGILGVAGNALEILAGMIAIVAIYPPLLVLFGGVDKKRLDELVHLVHNMPIMKEAIAYFGAYAGFFIRLLDAKS
ncbi:MAG: polysaccharide biosynthesis protein [Candidatus Micrarchaeota archaeon]|nr:polysaccharide biosynthesis protein [Candidatus Micrarchaeota archaeon]MDE1805059.1 polysaccharide biosynthesis protein [Candidatus Micrarchaeota archaeon]MDE1847251.1 polysaccharide biosynthesis protein [Candidatus Micrarchaeota archaeon]